MSLERRDEGTSEACWIKLQSTQGSVQQPTGSYGIVTSEVMERCGYLNQPLQEGDSSCATNELGSPFTLLTDQDFPSVKNVGILREIC
jgi:hypothetical protein